MVIRENNFVESMKFLKEMQDKRIEEAASEYRRKVREREAFTENYHSILESREQQRRDYAKLLESVLDSTFSKAIKAIYITALEAATLTDSAIILAESMVDSWIHEKGGAAAILAECKNKTYLLARINQIVCEAAEEEAEEIEKSTKDYDPDEDEEKEEKKEKEDDDQDDDDDKDDKEEKDDDEDEEDEDDDDGEDDSNQLPESESEDVKKAKADPLNTTFDDDVEIPDDATTEEDDNESDVAEDIVDDIEKAPEEDITVDGDTSNNGKLFDELEKEEDVQKAIELIRQRVADAEETFIKRNAEDKKAVDELIGRISDNVKTVEDMEKEAETDDEAKEKSEIAQEAVRMDRRRINAITENRACNVFEKMIRNLSEDITRDGNLRTHYVTENGSLDTPAIVESAKVMYGFLETVNTLQLEKVDEKYLLKVITEK